MDLESCRKQYFDCVRHLSSEQVALVEAGAPGESPKMVRAHELYLVFKAAQADPSVQGADNHSFMMQL